MENGSNGCIRFQALQFIFFKKDNNVNEESQNRALALEHYLSVTFFLCVVFFFYLFITLIKKVLEHIITRPFYLTQHYKGTKIEKQKRTK
jgi:hypothetical protein